MLGRLLIPPGRTMRDVDVVGIADDGKMIFAQVTYGRETDVSSKLATLRKFGLSGNAYLILFCRCDVQACRDGVIVFPLQKVFDAMTADDVGRRWLSAAVNAEAGGGQD